MGVLRGPAGVGENAARGALEQLQVEKLQALLEPVLQSNSFYKEKLEGAGLAEAAAVSTLEDYQRLPFTTKEELSADQVAHPPYGTNLTFERQHYIRVHQTSGTTGERLRWLDTEESWHWWGRCWATVYEGAGVRASDRIFFAFSFGPFIGFWSAHEGARHLGALAIPGGGMASEQRLDAILANQVTVLICTPTYALHLAEVAAAEDLDLAASSVRTTVHAGEPGAGLPSTRRRIQEAWGARCYDHAGATEVGAWGFECSAQAGLHLNEAEFICEVIDPDTLAPAPEGELVITSLGRVGMPVIRYRTGDRVRLHPDRCICGHRFRRLQGGVIGRIDDALIIRGVTVFPSLIENVVRRFPAVVEFAVDVRRQVLDEVEVRLEVDEQGSGDIAADVGRALRNALGLRAAVVLVPPNTLPRFELKARRFTDHRRAAQEGNP